MRKHLTAKLFKRLSLVALVVSLAGWVASEFFHARAILPFICVGINDSVFEIGVGTWGINRSEIDIGFGTFGIHVERTFVYEPLSLKLPQYLFPPPDYGHFSYRPMPPNSVYYLVIPFWLMTVVAMTAFLFFRWLDRRYAPPPGCCVHCGYDASRCTDNRCSECGEPLAVEAAAAG